MKIIVVWNSHGAGKLIGVFEEGSKKLNKIKKEIRVKKKKEKGYIRFIEASLNHQKLEIDE